MLDFVEDFLGGVRLQYLMPTAREQGNYIHKAQRGCMGEQATLEFHQPFGDVLIKLAYTQV